MTCPYPITVRGELVPCGKCVACRVNNRNDWNLRLQWEAKGAKSCYFVGLSYDDDSLPIDSEIMHPTLDPAHPTLFLKNIRQRAKRFFNGSLRYYLLGEYGTETHRPHHHLHLFADFTMCPYVECRHAGDQSSDPCNECSANSKCFVPHLRTAWPHGHVTAFPVTPSDIAYTTLHHVVGHTPPVEGLQPSYSTMSTRPAIGDYFFAQTELVDRLFTRGNVAFTYTPDGQVTRLPRYYRERIFSKPDLEALGLANQDDPLQRVKSENFIASWKRHSYMAKGKL